MEDVDVQTGETCRLAVVVEGKPDPDILWYKVRSVQDRSSVVFTAGTIQKHHCWLEVEKLFTFFT